jgi:unsaturated chondroitin disaccharide hydrolase
MDRHAMLSSLLARVEETRGQIGHAWPYHADPESGDWETVEDGDWCGGHWVECLRIAGRLEGRPELIEEARERTEWLRPKLEKDDQFRGHRFYYSAARLYAETGDPRMRTLALAAAYAVRSMAIPQNGAMPIGHEVQVKSTTLASRRIVAVDNVHPNLRLDFWAGPETGDPVFAEGARRMLDLTIRDFIRVDGSTVEFLEYHQTEDRILRHFTLLGVSDDSCWSRGQAWAIAGFLRGWQEYGETRYRDAARKLWGYWHGHVGTAPPPWDFDDPEGPRDTSASAILIEQLARMAVTDPNTEAKEFTEHLAPMIEGLAQHMRPTGRLVDGCFNRPKRFADRSELIWGTAYLLMALSYLEEGTVPC